MEKLAGRLINIVLLGFFSVLCSLPLVTVGASLTALHDAMSQYVMYDADRTLNIFFTSFKKYFKTATLVWLMHAAALAILVVDYLYYKGGDTTIDIIAQAAIFTLIAVLVFEMLMVFVVISQDMADNAWAAFKKALNISFTCLFETITLLILNIGIPILSAFIMPGFLLVLPGVITYFSWLIIPKMLKKYKFKRGNAEYQRERRKNSN
ncbi:MAG: YesL family protein [Erysipelotrichaceae bacterium]|nr:YesL family protein [Erysipelotrichaceae bacterium]